MIKTKRKFSTLILLLILALSVVALSGCGEEQARNDDDVVATVNGENILYGDFQTQLREFEEMAQMQGMEIDEETGRELEEQALEMLISEQLLLQEAIRKDIQVTDEEVNEYVAHLKSGFENEEQFEEALAAQGIAADQLDELVRKDLLILTLFEQVTPEASISEDDISDEEVNEIYEQQKIMAEMQDFDLPPLEEVEADIRAFIIQEQLQTLEHQAINDLIAELTENGEIEILL